MRAIFDWIAFWSMAFHDNIVGAVLGDSTLKMWEIDSGVFIHTLRTDGILTEISFDKNLLLSLAFHEESARFEDGIENAGFSLWDVESGNIVEEVMDKDVYLFLNFNDHRILYTTRMRGQIKIRDLKSRALLCTMADEGLDALCKCLTFC